MKKGLFALACICILVALAIDKVVLISSFWSVIKYGCMAYGITLLTYALCSKRITYVNTTLTMMGVILLTCYTIVLVDTFFFHTLPWLSGMIRYPIFSAYVPAYVLFIILGICLSFHE